jgi:ABC-type branched-subunit amino acid transport system substrate-binding protein
MSTKSWLLGLGRCAGALVVALTMIVAVSASAETIKVGAPIPQTGPFASDGTVMDKAIKLAVDEINKSGGLLGKQLEVLIFDIGDLTPDKLQASAANLIDRNKVDMLITGYGGFGPDIPAFCPYDVPYIHLDAFTSVIELMNSMGCTNIFNISDIEAAYGRALFDQMMTLGHDFLNKKLAIVHGPYEWESGLTQAMAEKAKAAGWEIVLQEEVPYESAQWPSILSKIRGANPGFIHIEVLDPSLTNTFIQQYLENPVKGALINAGYAASIPAFGEVITTGDVDGVLGLTLSAHIPGADGDAFIERWRAAYNEDPPYGIAAVLYDGVYMWAEAVKKVGSATDYNAVNKAILGSAYNGLTGVLDLNDRYLIPTNDDTQPSFLLQVQGKQLKPIRLGTKNVGDFVTPAWAQ